MKEKKHNFRSLYIVSLTEMQRNGIFPDNGFGINHEMFVLKLYAKWQIIIPEKTTE